MGNGWTSASIIQYDIKKEMHNFLVKLNILKNNEKKFIMLYFKEVTLGGWYIKIKNISIYVYAICTIPKEAYTKFKCGVHVRTIIGVITQSWKLGSPLWYIYISRFLWRNDIITITWK